MRLDPSRGLLIESSHSRRVMPKVLLAEHDAPLGYSVLHRLNRLDIIGEWVRSASELDAWAALLHRGPQLDRAQRRALEPSLVLLDWELPGAATGEPLGVLQGLLPSATIVVLSEGLTGDDAAVLLSRGVPSIHKPVHPFVLSTLALDLATESAPVAAGMAIDFENLVATYAASRRLSKQQALILDLYLEGKSDKEIAEICACSGATVYEHWRRMARKSGGRQKSDLVADFHRFLRGAPSPAASAAVAPSSVPPAASVPPAFVENLGLG
jgi:DNA-binding NarL/FixJ family response regulator